MKLKSGPKLVLLLCLLGLVASGVAWAVRWQATRKTLEFWGPEAADLFVGPAEMQVMSWPDGEPVDVGEAPGLVHLLHFLALDRSYDWADSPRLGETAWAWSVELSEKKKVLRFTLSNDFASLGKLNQQGEVVAAISVRPIAASLKKYFTAIGVPAGSSD